MASDQPYDDLVMEHIRNARNFRTLEGAHRQSHGTNVMCGDELSVYLKLEGERIEEAAFQCTCCGVSMASASIMTERVAGMTVADARAAVHHFVARVDAAGETLAANDDEALRALAATVERFPARRRCAQLPWLTLQAALADQASVAVT